MPRSAQGLERAAGHACGPYNVANVDVEAAIGLHQQPSVRARCGFAANQSSFAIETCMDMLAEKVGIDGWEMLAQHPANRRHLLDGPEARQTVRPRRITACRQGSVSRRQVRWHRLRHQKRRHRKRHARPRQVLSDR
ncbi:MAG: molybdopterin cofactor-binding domain-containing protein [Phycisphaerae bacterium]